MIKILLFRQWTALNLRLKTVSFLLLFEATVATARTYYENLKNITDVEKYIAVPETLSPRRKEIYQHKTTYLNQTMHVGVLISNHCGVKIIVFYFSTPTYFDVIVGK